MPGPFKLEDVKDIVIAKIDATANDVPPPLQYKDPILRSCEPKRSVNGREELRTLLKGKLDKKLSALNKFAEAYERRQHDLESLASLRQTISSFELGIHTEIELVTSGINTAFLSLSSTVEKQYSEQAGPYHAVKILLAPSGAYEIKVNIVDCAEKGTVDLNDHASLRKLVCKISSQSGYKVCPGLTEEEKYNDLLSKIGYQPKNAVCRTWPWSVMRHANCLLFHVPNNTRLSGSQIEDGLKDSCSSCKILSRDLNKILTRRESQRSEEKSGKGKVRLERKYYKTVANKYWQKSKVVLGQTESDELCRLVNEIESNEDGQKELENIFDEAETSRNGRGSTLREVWKKEKLDFLKDQRTNATGKKSNMWSTATFRIGELFK
ncbi:hypothetical protein OS493_021093 [Desmophyllum pertusum]|uniref:Uncharacterized protein n=1 Tax=Desmophyllum pertusum TaxID=174260 RepID=A0A9X0D2G4_9CNID|nr:hypothetical protein OS493_021093 [Desmophyllum pertusum]